MLPGTGVYHPAKVMQHSGRGLQGRAKRSVNHEPLELTDGLCTAPESYHLSRLNPN